MSMTWGPGLDAELTYRREQVARSVAPRRGRRFRLGGAPVVAVPRPRPAPSVRSDETTSRQVERTTSARAA